MPGGVLKHLKVAPHHAAAVRHDVGDHVDTVFYEHLLGLGRYGAVCELEDNLCLDVLGVPVVYHRLERGGDEHIHRKLEELLVRYGFHARGVFESLRYIETFFFIDTALGIRDCHHFASCLVEKPGDVAAHVPKALDRDGETLE